MKNAYNTSAYGSFAYVYDIFMDNVDYSAWSKYLIQLLKEYQVEDGLVLDLGCGTGNMTELLAEEGYDMIGVDNSEDMLEIASEKRAESGLKILYLLQDMREFELYGTVKAVVSIPSTIFWRKMICGKSSHSLTIIWIRRACLFLI